MYATVRSFWCDWLSRKAATGEMLGLQADVYGEITVTPGIRDTANTSSS